MCLSLKDDSRGTQPAVSLGDSPRHAFISQGSETDACSQGGLREREPRQYPNQSISPAHLIKTPERLSNDLSLFASPRYPLRDWMELPGAVLGKEQVPPLGLGWGHGVRGSLKLIRWELLNSK